jgi:hypothetical protein
MLLAGSEAKGRYIYECREDPKHVKLETSCDDPTVDREERIFLSPMSRRG